jgi:hypothetical protein
MVVEMGVGFADEESGLGEGYQRGKKAQAGFVRRFAQEDGAEVAAGAKLFLEFGVAGD